MPGGDPGSFAYGKDIGIFPIGYAVKSHTDTLAYGSTALLEMNVERDRVGIFPRCMKSIAADLPHLHRHLTIARLNTTGFGNDDALETHVSAW